MLQKEADSRSNSKDLKDFIIKFKEIETLKNELNRKTAKIQIKTEENVQLKESHRNEMNLLQDETLKKTEENDQLKASRNLLQDENRKLKQINNNLNMENEKYKTLQNNSEIVIQNYVAENKQETENLESLLNKSNNAKAMNIMPAASKQNYFFFKLKLPYIS